MLVNGPGEAAMMMWELQEVKKVIHALFVRSTVGKSFTNDMIEKVVSEVEKKPLN